MLHDLFIPLCVVMHLYKGTGLGLSGFWHFSSARLQPERCSNSGVGSNLQHRDKNASRWQSRTWPVRAAPGTREMCCCVPQMASLHSPCCLFFLLLLPRVWCSEQRENEWARQHTVFRWSLCSPLISILFLPFWV